MATRNTHEQAAYDAGFRDGKAGLHANAHGAPTSHYVAGYRNGTKARNRAEKNSVLRDLGLRKVRGSRGGVYWE